MNQRAFLHIQDSQYCYAIDEKTVEIMLRTSADDTFDKITLVYGNKYDYHLRRERAELSPKFSDGVFKYYTLKLQLQDVRFVYIFEIICNGETYFYSEDGITERYDFSLAYYNSFQLPYINAADVHKPVPWMKSAVFYQIFVDRFNKGKTDKDITYVNMNWGDLPTAKSFAGGDLQGVAEKLDYLKGLGINALYLTPIFTSKSNHKYDISDYFEIDAHFGNKEIFANLVKQAHARGIRIVLDAVFNHCSENLRQFQDVVKNGRQSPYFNWFIINGDKPNKKADNYEHFGVCKYMPKLNTSNPEVQNYLCEIASYWIKEFDIDGWRLDVSDEVSHDFWRVFRKAVKAAKPDCIILGENWHDSYSFLRGDQFDGIMNYALTKALLDYFADATFDAQALANKLNALYVRNTSIANSMMLNLLDSHDTHRFYTLCGRNQDKLICALAILYLYVGANCIFYGTEIPLEGGYDPDCRRTMDWQTDNKYLKNVLKNLSELKKRQETVDGDISFKQQDGLFVLERTAENTLRLVVNNSDEKLRYLPQGEVVLCHNFADGAIDNVGFVIEEVKH